MISGRWQFAIARRGEWRPVYALQDGSVTLLVDEDLVVHAFVREVTSLELLGAVGDLRQAALDRISLEARKHVHDRK